MKIWHDEDGVAFKNSDVCYGREYKPDTDTVDVAKISIRGEYPANGGWGRLKTSHEMAVVVRGNGYVDVQGEGRHELKTGDVFYVEPMTWFRWGGDLDMIIPCGPAFNPEEHELKEGDTV